MGVIPDRQDFVRRLTQSGAYTEAEAMVLAGALDATLRQPATRLDSMQLRADFLQQMGDLRAEVRADFADLRAGVRKDLTDHRAEAAKRFAGLEAETKVLAERIERVGDRAPIRISAVVVVVATALFGALGVWPAGG